MRRILQRFDQRLNVTPILRTIQQTRPPNYISFWDAPIISPGRIALLLVFFLVISGLALALFYNPTAERAASSIAYIHEEQPLGWLTRNTHRWSALLLFAFTILHALRVWIQQVYRYPRDLNWWVGLSLLLVVIILGGTGYILRWDVKAFVILDLVVSNLSDVPFLRSSLVSIILGGSELDVVPLYRGYAIHIWFLPMVLVLLIAFHLLIVWRQGIAHLSHSWQTVSKRMPLKRWRHLLPGLILLAVIIILSAVTPYELENGPSARTALPHPDWLLTFYLLPFWFFNGEARVIGALIVPLALLLFMAMAPWLARQEMRRTLARISILLAIIGIIWLFAQMSVMGYQIPLGGCQACHRETIVGGAPTQLSEFDIRDPDWLVFHLKDPQGSLLVPFSSPER